MKQPEKLQSNRHFLFIDSASQIPEAVLFCECKNIEEIKFENDRSLSEELLQKIEGTIRKHQISKADLSAIFVNPGPGSYTGLRVGVTTANTLAFSLNIPILSAKKENVAQEIESLRAENDKFSCPVMPIYGQPPHITQKKRRL